MNSIALSPAPVAASEAPLAKSSKRPLVGLAGIFLAAMMAGQKPEPSHGPDATPLLWPDRRGRAKGKTFLA